ncbi:predicted protein [Naegleria gruberi]|uniref:Predicted protein n=1 Tax=Naegleria gruberi TaxID=5762 RepID=D2V7B5_NAEGR|nr:uncharacterized protein NAEGRDRAFT_47246 [Naegleria gruberi]EFC47348.1 predicted protein [Naegleria gruberi]|eukprot:XP_002680092.1 predicted protein [Naegleria gruberi strain NEG-M]
MNKQSGLLSLIRENWIPLTKDLSKSESSLTCYDSLLKAIGDSKLVLIGEASHGTHEFYEHRAAITKRLISEKGFNCICLEADFPDTSRVNEFIKHQIDCTGVDSLSGFKRFPTWMWRNVPTLNLVEWLREYNTQFNKEKDMVGLYGLDLYSSDRSMRVVLEYFESIGDHEGAKHVREQYECMKNYKKKEPIRKVIGGSCQEKVMQVLLDLQNRETKELQEKDHLFNAIQNAMVVKNAEHYYRVMFVDGSWNIRDEHFFETLVEIMKYYSNSYGKEAKVIVFAHNSHVGDASQTDSIYDKGHEINIGRKCRENFPDDVYIVGFSTFNGSVTAADKWNQDPEYKRVNPGMKDSIEELLHDATIGQKTKDYMLLFKSKDPSVETNATLRRELEKERLERAIGVIYRPKTERQSHYFEAKVAKQFDALIHFNTTTAVHPIDMQHQWAKKRLEETYPTGL